MIFSEHHCSPLRSVRAVEAVVKISVNGYVHAMKSAGYRLGKRAEQQARTRQRIIDATAALHAEVGPAATTVSAVAERAGVQRLTVYRHFPDEASLLGACAAHTGARHPPPDPALWSGVEEPRERVAAALAALYAYYREREPGLAHVLRDAEQMPALDAALAPMREYLEEVAEGLAAGWRVDAGAERVHRAALAHALDFWSWRSLAARGLDDAASARLMARLVGAGAEG